MPLVLRESHVQELLTMAAALDAVEGVFYRLATGRATNRPRQRVTSPTSVLHLMAAGDRELGLLATKVYTSSRAGARFLVLLYAEADGELLAVIEADRLGQMRTGAASGVATRHMARADASTVGIIGTGWQAESQLMAVCAVRRIRSVKAYSRHLNRCKLFAQKLAPILNAPVDPVDSPEDAVRDQSIVITATTAREPVVDGTWIGPGTHVNAVGSNRLSTRELDLETIRRAAILAVDSVEQCRLEAGDLLPAVERGALAWESVVELGRIVAGQVPGRTTDEEITLFKSTGLAIEDLATAAALYELAVERRVGDRLEMWGDR